MIYVDEHERRFLRPYLLGARPYREKHIPNGINIEPLLSHDLKPIDNNRNNPFVFLAFGGRNVQKRIDLVLEASRIVDSRFKGKIKTILTIGTDTEAVVKSLFPDGDLPEWLTLLPQTADITKYYSMADCFISSSIFETFSFAVCEASIFGLPVIQSDIDGTKWNANNPSTVLFRSLDVEDLARAMENIMNTDKKELFNNVMKTRQINSSKYGINTWCEKIASFYEDL